MELESFEDKFMPKPDNEEQEIVDEDQKRLERIRKEKELAEEGKDEEIKK